MDRDKRRIDAFLPVRAVEFQILLSLASGERHGYGIIRDAETRGDKKVPDVGTLYRALARMTEQGSSPAPTAERWPTPAMNAASTTGSRRWA